MELTVLEAVLRVQTSLFVTLSPLMKLHPLKEMLPLLEMQVPVGATGVILDEAGICLISRQRFSMTGNFVWGAGRCNHGTYR